MKENIELKEKYEDEKQKYDSAKANSRKYLDLIAKLGISSENESFASVNSRIYAVPMGGTEYINVNFKADTLYLSGYSEYIDADWTDSSNIKISGKKRGIDAIYLSDNEQGYNEMTIVIICY